MNKLQCKTQMHADVMLLLFMKCSSV